MVMDFINGFTDASHVDDLFNTPEDLIVVMLNFCFVFFLVIFSDNLS